MGIELRKVLNDARYLTKGAKLLYGFATERPFLCNWQITYRCSFQCDICSFWRDDRPAQDELTIEQVRQVAEKLKPLGPLVISMAGGEPLMRRDLPEITRILSRDHFFSLITNGWLLTRERAEELYDAGLQDIHVSLDYASAERHDAQRGVKGAFERAIAALRSLHDARPDRKHRVHIMAVLLDDNVGDLEGLMELAEELGVSFELTLYSHRRGQKPVRAPSKPVVDYLRELKRRHPSFISFDDYLSGFDTAREGGLPVCRGGKTFFNIDHRGRVSRCIDTNDSPAGDLLTESLEEIWPKLRAQASGDPCSECWTSCRGFADIIAGPQGIAKALPDFVQAIRPF